MNFSLKRSHDQHAHFQSEKSEKYSQEVTWEILQSSFQTMYTITLGENKPGKHFLDGSVAKTPLL